ncbi:MAG: ribosomal RNA small subunit methyltransferase A [Balneola sp.]|nr:ribosomal RNA small subunit methyltransferase A [Balneola sp.]|tara:strand:+ start:2883 stop:3704 length:822 start_codon:yes stop_codon:yes gene_type:complete
MSTDQFRTKKRLGQHFLTDKNVLSNIISAFPATSNDWVLEIGPGTGALTQYLWPRYPRLELVEVDAEAVEVLKGQFKGVTIHQEDILKVKLLELIPEQLDAKRVYTNQKVVNPKNFVIGNLPYYITSPILFVLLEHRIRLAGALLMMQKEVAQRLIAIPRTKDYGILSVQTQLMSTPKYLFDVKPGSFSPPPNVTSALVYVHFDKPSLGYSDKMLKDVVRTAFNQRRKKLSNALKAMIKGIDCTSFDLNVRAEEWTPDIYAEFTAFLERQNPE